MSRLPRFSVIIPNYNGKHYLEECLASVEACDFPRSQVEYILVDNGSTDGSAEFVKSRFPSVLVVKNKRNIGFTGAITAGVEAAAGEHVVFLNNDMRVHPQWLSAFESVLCGNEAVCATGRILNWDGTKIDFEEGILLFDGHALQRYHGAKAESFRCAARRPAFIACGGNMAVRKDLFARLGGFDQDFFAYTEDVDFSWRMHAAGHSISFVPEAVVFHHHQGTSSTLGVYNRGYLYEKNAYVTLFKNIDLQYFHIFMHLAWITLVHRTCEIISLNSPSSEALSRDPFAERVSEQESGPSLEAVGIPRTGGYRRWLDAAGALQAYLAQHGFLRTLGRAMSRLGESIEYRAARRGGGVPIEQGVNLRHPRIISQLQAVWHVMANMERIAGKREAVQRLRRVPDREIFQEFPPWLVTTYPGDERLFKASWFRELLPEDIPFRLASLDQVHGDP